MRAKFHFDHELWGIGSHVKFFHLSHCCYDWHDNDNNNITHLCSAINTNYS